MPCPRYARARQRSFRQVELRLEKRTASCEEKELFVPTDTRVTSDTRLTPWIMRFARQTAPRTKVVCLLVPATAKPDRYRAEKAQGRLRRCSSYIDRVKLKAIDESVLANGTVHPVMRLLGKGQAHPEIRAFGPK
jgi:hypothetical protein